MNKFQVIVLVLLLHLKLTKQEVQNEETRISWFVHLSDIHLSKWQMNPVDPRERDLNLLFKNVISKINPATVLITGDLADSVNKQEQGQQYPEEWQAYNRILHMISNYTKLEKIPDIRGNHDMYNVGCKGGGDDFYARFGSRGTVDNDKLLYVDEINGQFGGDEVGCPSVVLLGLDLTPNPGFRGPTNFAALITKKLLKRLNDELYAGLTKYEQCHNITTFIAYGHYPLCVATYIDIPLWQQAFNFMETNLRIEDLFSKYNITAYLNGHLHNFFGERLHRLIPANKILYNINNEYIDGKFGQQYYKRKTSFMDDQFIEYRKNQMRGYIAELETADWMWSRRFRIMAIDDGTLSFQDLQYHVRRNGTSIASIESKFVHVQNFVILITHPVDGRYSPLIGAKKSSDKLRALIFNIGDIILNQGYIVEAFLLCENNNEKINITMNLVKEPLYEGDLSKGGCKGVGNITVLVLTSSQQQLLQIDSYSSIPIKLDSDNFYPLPLDQTLDEYVTLRVHWPAVAFWIFYGPWGFIFFVMLILPYFVGKYTTFFSFYKFAEHRGSWWRYPLMPIYYLCVFAFQGQPQQNTSIKQKQHEIFLFRNSPLSWKIYCVYIAYLGFCPWLLIRVLSEKQAGYAFPFGVILRINQNLEYSPTPELLVIFSFQLILVVFPGTLWLAWTFCTQCKNKNRVLKITVPQVFVGFFLFYVNVRIIGLIVGWYDVMALVVSPGVGWFVPFIIFVLYVINYEVKNGENLGLYQVLGSVAIQKTDKLVS